MTDQNSFLCDHPICDQAYLFEKPKEVGENK